MALAVHFGNGSMSKTQYDECLKRLEAAGAGAPKGRLYHASFGTPERLQVFDIWDSQESFEAFGKTLIPILQQLGIDVGQPTILPLQNVIKG